MGAGAGGGVTAIRTIFRRAFAAAGLDYLNPHSFRKTLMIHAQQTYPAHEVLTAWSKDLGHQTITTSLAGTCRTRAAQTVRRSILRSGAAGAMRHTGATEAVAAALHTGGRWTVDVQ
jgi:hypothetical protein